MVTWYHYDLQISDPDTHKVSLLWPKQLKLYESKIIQFKVVNDYDYALSFELEDKTGQISLAEKVEIADKSEGIVKIKFTNLGKPIKNENLKLVSIVG